MQENVFVAWSGSNDYAVAISKALRVHNYNAIVGGNAKNDNSIVFVGQTIISQMKLCPQAILIIQVKKSDGQISPNLLFEFGYLLNKLKYDKLHVYFIDIQKDSVLIPSDIQGIWADFLFSNMDLDKSIIDYIISSFLSRQYQIVNIDKIDYILNWLHYKNAIKKYCIEPNITHFELAQLLLFSMQSVYYNEDYEETDGLIDVFFRTFHSFSPELRCSLKFCAVTLKFYRIYFSSDNQKLTINEIYDMIDEYESILEQAKFLDENEFKCWLYACIYEHLGFLLYWFLLFSDVDHDEEEILFSTILDYNSLALEYLNELDNGKYKSNNNFYFCTLFKAYVFRQKALSHHNLYLITHDDKQKNKENECFVSSFEMRQKLHNNFSHMKTNSKVIESMEIDYFLSMTEILTLEKNHQKRKRYLQKIHTFLEKHENKCNRMEEYINQIRKKIYNYEA